MEKGEEGSRHGLQPRPGKAGRTQIERVNRTEPSSQALEGESKARVKIPESEAGSNQTVGMDARASQGASHNC